MKARNSLNNTRWPSSNPKILSAEYSNIEEVSIPKIFISFPILICLYCISDENIWKISSQFSQTREWSQCLYLNTNHQSELSLGVCNRCGLSELHTHKEFFFKIIKIRICLSAIFISRKNLHNQTCLFIKYKVLLLKCI